MNSRNYMPIIGLEVHVELATDSKMFCGCSAEHFGVEPNTHTCPVCLGLPGALPVPNKKAVEWTIKLALALECKINEETNFDRKNYFYPDLPKGYQITQYERPFGENGELIIEETKNRGKSDEIRRTKTIRIRRVHLEEDTGKLQHTEIDGPASAKGFGEIKQKVALVDFNRSGVPLVEIVTEPDFRSIEEVDLYLKKLQRIIRYLGISGADMEKGSMRIEPSISMCNVQSSMSNKLPNDQLPNYRVELKNINSFRFARKGIEYEIKRQTKMLENGETPIQQTRGWNEIKGETVPQRGKEEAHDYRYFPEPDIPEIRYKKEDIRKITEEIPELPDEKKMRFKESYGLSEYDADLLVESRETADFFEEAVKVIKNETMVVGSELKVRDNREWVMGWGKRIANWIINKKVDPAKVVPAEIVKEIVGSQKTTEIPEERMTEIVNEVIRENQNAVEDFRKGKTAVLGFLIGKGIERGGKNIDKGKLAKTLQEQIQKS